MYFIIIHSINCRLNAHPGTVAVQAPTAPPPIYQAHPSYYSTIPNASAGQMVPYTPQPQGFVPPQQHEQKKTPLTPTELQRLYSQGNRNPYAVSQPAMYPQFSSVQHYVPPSLYPALTPPIIGNAQMAPALPPRNPVQINAAAAPPAVPPRNVVPAIILPSLSMVLPSNGGGGASSSRAESISSDVQLRPKKSKENKNLGGDLIDLDNGMDEWVL